MTYRPTDWLNSWLNENAQRQLGDKALERGVSLHSIGATQIRFMLHALQGIPAAIQLTAQQDGQTSRHWPVVIDQERNVARVYPGGWKVALGADAQEDPRRQLEHFPDADPELFQGFMARAIESEQFQDFFKALHGYAVPSERPTAEWFDGTRSLADLRRTMNWHFGCDEALGAQRDESGDTVLPCGGTFSRCTNSAHMTAQEFGGVVSGFLVDENPAATNEQVQGAGGHDFTVINGRYVVDLWIGIFTGATAPNGQPYPCVYDLYSNDPAEKALNESIYGDRGTWRVLEDYSPIAVANQQPKGATQMSATINIDMVPYDVEIENDWHLAIKGCSGSILAKLNNDPEVTGNRFSDELRFCVVESDNGDLRAYEVSYHAEDGGTLYLSPCDGGKPSLDEVETWVSSAYHGIESVQHEVLLDSDELEQAMYRHRTMMSPG